MWQSIHARPVGTDQVDELLVQPLGEEVTPLPEGTLLHRELGTGWLDLNLLLSRRQAACLDLACLLGIETVAGATLAAVEETTAGDRPAYALEVVLPADFTRTLLVDRQSYDLIAVEDRDRGDVIARLEHRERRALTGPDVSEAIFAALPAGVSLVRAGEEAAGAVDRVWIVSATPAPGSSLEGPTRFEVVGYELASLPEALLQVALARPGYEQTEGRLPLINGGQMQVEAPGGEVTVSFSVNPAEEQWPGRASCRFWSPWRNLAVASAWRAWPASSLPTIRGKSFPDTAWQKCGHGSYAGLRS